MWLNDGGWSSQDRVDASQILNFRNFTFVAHQSSLSVPHVGIFSRRDPLALAGGVSKKGGQASEKQASKRYRYEAT
jgi:hypothetical protein